MRADTDRLADAGLNGHGRADGTVAPAANGHAGAARGYRPPAQLAPRGPSRRDSQRRRLLALSDLAALCCAYTVVWALAPLDITRAQTIGVAAVLLPGWALLNKLLNLYDRDSSVIFHSTLDELPRIALSIVLGTSAVYLLAPLLAGIEVTPVQALLFDAAGLLAMSSLRALSRAVFERHAEQERCLIVGNREVADQLVSGIAWRHHPHPEIVGLVGASELAAERNGAPATVDNRARFAELCHELGVERVIVASSSLPPGELLAVTSTAKELNLKVSLLPRRFEVLGDSMAFEQLGGMTLIGLKGLYRPRSSLRLKRLIDCVGAGAGLVLGAPLLLAIAVGIKLTSPGPVLFGQQRIGRKNRPFTLYKFRTMLVGADTAKEGLAHLNEASRPMFKIAADPRVTGLGRTLRRHYLDELPQLWNVLRGEMTLVGPRPLIPAEDGWVVGPHRARLELTPGVTGPWQIMGRPSISFDEMIELDYMYVAQWSLWTDIKLLLRTVPIVLLGRGH